MRARGAVAALIACCLLTQASAASAQSADPFVALSAGDDVVMLRDGSSLRGRIVERVPGDHVLLRTADGRSVRVAWGDLAETPFEPSASHVDFLPIIGVLGLVGTLGGGGTLIASAAVHDDSSRKGMQIGGGIALGVGGALLVITLAVGFARAAPAMAAVH